MNTVNIHNLDNKTFKQLVGTKIFSCEFLKKDGTLRKYNARVNVSKHTKGGVNTVEHKPNLCTIFEMGSQQYRTLNLSSVKSFTCGEYKYKVGE